MTKATRARYTREFKEEARPWAPFPPKMISPRDKGPARVAAAESVPSTDPPMAVGAIFRAGQGERLSL